MCVVLTTILMLTGAGRLPSSSTGALASAAGASRSPVRPAGSGVNVRAGRAVLLAMCVYAGAVSSTEDVF